jgi:hypothetical protein
MRDKSSWLVPNNGVWARADKRSADRLPLSMIPPRLHLRNSRGHCLATDIPPAGDMFGKPGQLSQSISPPFTPPGIFCQYLDVALAQAAVCLETQPVEQIGAKGACSAIFGRFSSSRQSGHQRESAETIRCINLAIFDHRSNRFLCAHR